jgi:hypothetical protein
VDPVEELERRFMPLLEGTRERLVARFPDYRFSIYSGPVGGATSYQGYDVGLECFMPEAAPHQTNNVALSIGLMHLASEPMIAEAGVGWGGDGSHPDVDLELVHHPLTFSGAALTDLERDYPRLDVVFEQAIDAWQTQSPA